MNKPSRTAAEMREAAAQVVLTYPNASPWEKAQRIRALPVAEAADDEALVEIVARAIYISHEPMTDVSWHNLDRFSKDWHRDEARAVLAALREAGALR